MIFTKESWDNYKEYLLTDFPTFEGYMDFCFQDTNEPTLPERTNEALKV